MIQLFLILRFQSSLNWLDFVLLDKKNREGEKVALTISLATEAHIFRERDSPFSKIVGFPSERGKSREA